ncbi:hypothetical protein ARMGADRAFT_1075990 [Armillaria gallica]|uniref:Uncharacterized protein n=1 Tax=Armillaria gallica TaxID=47427 RepID=A0A2H3E1F5_ARMGA|nr:hypothetical protein ARMGADRAFT_1075990 [Armillaria gallica]
MVAARTFIEVQHHVPLDMRVDICTTHFMLIQNVQNLDKTRWGHLKNLMKYMRLKKDVKSHCNYVEHYSAFIKAKNMLEEAEGAAKEAAEQAEALEAQTEEEPLDILEEDLRDIYKRDGRWTRVKGRLPRT